MNKDFHIGIFYSYGPHFIRTVRSLRADSPEARITAFVPAEFPAGLLGGLDVVLAPILGNPAERRSPGVLLSIVRAIRRQRLDVFVVLFDSPRLRLLAALSGARERQCCLVDGRTLPVRVTIAGNVFRTLGGRLRGQFRYARIWLSVHLTRVGRSPAEEPEQDAGPPDAPASPRT